MMLLTKSNYLLGLQCLKYLWVAVHEKERLPKASIADQRRMNIGIEVGELAKGLFSKGIDVPAKPFLDNIKKTKELLDKRKIIFEGGVLVDSLFSRADVLEPVGKDEWDILEVKSGTKVKEENVHDVSFQKYVYELGGLKIRKCYLVLVNKDYVRKGKIDPKKLLYKEDITEQVNVVSEGIKERVKAMVDVINQKKCPGSKISKECVGPKECPLEECWGFLPENNVFHLYRAGKKRFELIDKGIYALDDIPNDYKLTGNQTIQRKCAKTGKPHIDKEKLKEFLNKLEYPLNYLDFEAINSAIPFYDGTKPYQQIPFQFSLHVQNDSNLEHYSFLANGKDDPRKEFIAKLKEMLGDKGNILVYNQTFEKTVLKQLAEAFPKYKKWIDSVLERIVDLLIPFRNFHYYNPTQKGSASIKEVLPAVTGKGYGELNIAGGEDAMIAFLSITFGDEKNKEKVREDLLKYCGLDTEGMVWIVDELRKLVK